MHRGVPVLLAAAWFVCAGYSTHAARQGDLRRADTAGAGDPARATLDRHCLGCHDTAA